MQEGVWVYFSVFSVACYLVHHQNNRRVVSESTVQVPVVLRGNITSAASSQLRLLAKLVLYYFQLTACACSLAASQTASAALKMFVVSALLYVLTSTWYGTVSKRHNRSKPDFSRTQRLENVDFAKSIFLNLIVTGTCTVR